MAEDRKSDAGIYRCESGPAHINGPLEDLAHRLMADDRNATRRTNYGGWHYAFDLFELQDGVVEEFRRLMEQHVQAFINHFRPEARRKRTPSGCAAGST